MNPIQPRTGTHGCLEACSICRHGCPICHPCDWKKHKPISPNTQSREDELCLAILQFDKSRGQTGADYVTGKITQKQADSEFEDDIAQLVSVIHQRESALLDKVEAEAPKDKYSPNEYTFNQANTLWRKALSSVRKEHGL